MLNGIYPILIFNFKKLVPQLAKLTSGVPLLAEISDSVPLTPIPLYLKEELTGLYITHQSKNVDIDTTAQTLPDGTTPKVKQAGINTTITINLVGRQDAIPLQLLIAMIDLIFQKVSSQEYSISYLNGPITVFNGLLEGFSVQEGENNDLFNVQLQISRIVGGSTVEKLAPLTVSSSVGALPL